MKRNKSE